MKLTVSPAPREIAHPVADCAPVPLWARQPREGRFTFDDGSPSFAIGANTWRSGLRGTYDYDELFRSRLHCNKDAALKVRWRSAS
ncbi:MAG: hypothetical protein K6U89_18005 [Chloroflexi bacterium]|nr:hypothetical protein [Chloroflexota bacterium]